MKKLLLTLLGAALALPAVARDFTYTYEGQTLNYNTLDGSTCEVARNSAADGSIVIPTNVVYNGQSYSVTIIGEGAFLDCSGLTSVTIPNTVTEISLLAFSHCTDLTSVTIPNSVTTISERAFYKCRGLTSVNIGNSVTSIGAFAFISCRGLTSVTIPNSVTSIGSSAFEDCTGLTSVTIPNSVTSIGSSAFEDCTGLTSVTIPNSVTKIGSYAFYRCSGLTSVTIPNSVTSIGEEAFSGCTGLTSVTYLAEEPIVCDYNPFSEEVYENATLNYLQSAKDKIDITQPWNRFKHRVGRDAEPEGSISEVENLDSESATVYNLRGVKVGESTEGLPKGIYIVRQGSSVKKIAI